jgi:hypothetical protein
MQKKEPGLTAEVFALINQHNALLERPKQVFAQEEIQAIYDIYNAYTGQKETVSSCGGCRQSKITKVRKIYEEYKQSL